MFSKKSIILLALVAGILVLPFFIQPGITGYASADFFSKKIDLTLDKDMNYYLDFDGINEEVPLTGVMLTGKVFGQGKANIYLEVNGQLYLVYSNVRRFVPNYVTGMFTVEDMEGCEVKFEPENDAEVVEINEEQLKALLSDIQPTEEGVYYESEFENACVDTCFLNGLNETRYKFVFDLDENVGLKVDEVIFSVLN